MRLIFWLILLIRLSSHLSDAFVGSRVATVCWTAASASRRSITIILAATSSAQDVQNLVEQLSLESDDVTRRAELQTWFANVFQNDTPDDTAQQYTNDFQDALVTVGNRVQQAAAEATANAAANNKDDHHDLQRQLWALVDMMVQSKTIIRKIKEQEQQS